MKQVVNDWTNRANDFLQRQYGVTIADAGYTAEEFVSRWMSQGETPEESITAFAEKYGLRSLERW